MNRISNQPIQVKKVLRVNLNKSPINQIHYHQQREEFGLREKINLDQII
jgi:hypothetical protein